jgi:hypothetical protein
MKDVQHPELNRRKAEAKVIFEHMQILLNRGIDYDYADRLVSKEFSLGCYHSPIRDEIVRLMGVK